MRVYARLAFEFSNLLIGIWPPDDAEILPVSLQRIGENNAFNGFACLGEFGL